MCYSRCLVLMWVCYYQISRCVCGALGLDRSWLRLWGLLVCVGQTGVIHERPWCSSRLCLISINGFTPPHVSTRTNLCRLMLFAPRSHVCRGCSRTLDPSEASDRLTGSFHQSHFSSCWSDCYGKVGSPDSCSLWITYSDMFLEKNRSAKRVV